MRLDLIPSGRFASSLSCHSTMSIHVAGLVVSFLKQTHLPVSIVSGSTAPPTDAIHSSPPSRPPVCWPFNLRPHFPSSSSHRGEMDTSLFSHSHHDDVSAPPHVLAQPSIIYRPTPLLWFLIKKREIDYTGWMRSATRPEIRNHHNRSLGASEQPHLTSPHLTAQYVWPPVHSSSESSSNWICLRHREESSPQEESNSFAVLYWYGMVSAHDLWKPVFLDLPSTTDIFVSLWISLAASSTDHFSNTRCVCERRRCAGVTWALDFADFLFCYSPSGSIISFKRIVYLCCPTTGRESLDFIVNGGP